MFFPIGDTQISGGYKPIVSYTLIDINVLVFFVQLSSPGNLICQFSAIPIDIIKGDSYFTLFSSMFIHGSWMHLLGEIFPKRLFYGLSSLGNEALSTSGGSLKSIFRKNHYFQVSLGSISGSDRIILFFTKNFSTF